MSYTNVRDLAIPDPEIAELLKTRPTMPDVDSIAQLRAMMAHMIAARGNPPVPSGISEEDRQIPMRDGHQISVRIHRPVQKPSKPSPLFVLFHGGGYCVGDVTAIEAESRFFVQKFGATVVNVDYRLAPEHPFPVPVQDAFDGLKWAAANAQSLGADPSAGFIVGGSSAGGNFATVVSHLAASEKVSPPLTGVYASIPATLHHDAVPEKYKSAYISYSQNKDAPILNAKTHELFADNYKPDPHSPLFSSLLSSSHAGLPKHYLQVCGLDPLRDEGLLYEKVLREENGISTKLDIYPGAPHGFWSFCPEAKLAQKFWADLAEGTKWLLE